MDKREMFEAWWTRDVLPEYSSLRPLFLKSNENGEYQNPRCQGAWEVWQAAHRTTPDREAWISVAERVPPPGTSEVLAWNSEGWCAVVNPEYVSPAFPEYTHWMTLPTAPTSDKGGA